MSKIVVPPVVGGQGRIRRRKEVGTLRTKGGEKRGKRVTGGGAVYTGKPLAFEGHKWERGKRKGVWFGNRGGASFILGKKKKGAEDRNDTRE